MRLDEQPTRDRSSALYAAIVRRGDPGLGAAARPDPEALDAGLADSGRSRAILGVALAISTLVKVIQDNEFQTRWAWIGLALALAIMFSR